MIRNIGVLTSGGDSPGMNAAARAVVRTVLYEGGKVFGIYDGYRGLLDEHIEELSSRSVSDILQRGGTFLGTARCKRFTTPEGRMQAYENMKKYGIEGLVIIGGDGSLRGASKLSAETGVPIVGLPGTIDNDVWGTDYTIGCDTAANTIIDAINKLRDTASAHSRIAVVEVMGRRCGWLATLAGIAGGAEVVGSGVDIGKYIEEKTQMDVRVSVLGHIQRGGSPSVQDRVKASQLGEKAALALMAGQTNVVFGFNKGKVVAINLHDAITNKKPLDPEYIELADMLV